MKNIWEEEEENNYIALNKEGGIDIKIDNIIVKQEIPTHLKFITEHILANEAIRKIISEHNLSI